MKIIDKDSGAEIDRVILKLSFAEARQTISYLEDLMNMPLGNHFHLESKDLEKEITFCLLDENQKE